MHNPFRDLTKFEFGLWLSSVTVVALSYILSGAGDFMTALSSITGVTALIFVAKGYVIGQALCLVFSVFYGIVSFFFGYYGEMITYLGMSAPAALMAVISWVRHPYKGSKTVEVSSVTKKQWIFGAFLTVVATVAFYFILSALNTKNIGFSTLSVTTSIAASYLTFLRSPWYAIGYSLNDIVLIVLWVLASIENISYIPMIVCFIMFLFNDLYGFYNWRRLKTNQIKE
ncbi:MAG: nicotinamide mononucleotide transporter [Ruminococcaceae bacterium]|nr:nicotinamide mononucleotide transporter [Oscillospiraceae bacterium]